jgi:hypothetical protein
MLLIRVVLLAALVSLHVIGGAVVFRKWFPRESPWWGFFAPTLALVALLNFIEHGLALPNLLGLLPLSTGGLMWALVKWGGRVRGALRIPGAIFLGGFAFALLMKGLQANIDCRYTEGLTDTNRILNFCLGDKLPPTDSWLPPYRHTGYYTFLPYGASVLKRLLGLDLGTACNVSAALVSALMLVGAGAAAYSLSRGRLAVTIMVVILFAGGFTGSSPWFTLFQPTSPDAYGSIDLMGVQPAAGDHAAFRALLRSDDPQTAYRLYTPGCYLYYPEFHATMGGHLLAVWAVFAASEVMRRKRSRLPWIYLMIAPVLAFITCTLFIFMVTLLASTVALAWWIGRRPANGRHVLAGGVIGLTLLGPAFCDLAEGAVPQALIVVTDLSRDRWSFLIQWWPIYLPWLLLWFYWPRINAAQRWLHVLVLPILLVTETLYVHERGETLEKTWSGTFGIGMAMLYPTLLAQRSWAARLVTVMLMLTGVASLVAWILASCNYAAVTGCFLQLRGDHFLRIDPQMARMEVVLDRLHGQTVITGMVREGWMTSTALPAFTENRCYLGWPNAEVICGYEDEANFREGQINAFFGGTMHDPLGFLASNKIGAILVWPEDHLSDGWLAAMRTTLEPAYAYVDCKGTGADNAGVFLRKPDSTVP